MSANGLELVRGTVRSKSRDRLSATRLLGRTMRVGNIRVGTIRVGTIRVAIIRVATIRVATIRVGALCDLAALCAPKGRSVKRISD